MKKTIVCLLATILMLNGCNHKEPNNTQAQQGELITITVSMPNELKVAYNDEKVGQGALTWEEGDQILVVGKNDEDKYIGSKKFTLSSGKGTDKASFTGRKIPNATKYDVHYGNVELKGNEVKVSMDKQKQSGNNSTDHLKRGIYLSGSVWGPGPESEYWYCYLEMKSAIMKLELSNLPTDIGTLQNVTWGVITKDGSGTYEIAAQPLELENITTSTNSLTAYVGFFPEEIKPMSNGGSFYVMLVGSAGKKVVEIPTKKGKEYRSGERYTAKISKATGEWKEYVPILDRVAERNLDQTGKQFAPDWKNTTSGYFSFEEAGNLFTEVEGEQKNLTIDGKKYFLPSKEDWYPIFYESGGEISYIAPHHNIGMRIEKIDFFGKKMSYKAEYKCYKTRVLAGLRYQGGGNFQRSAWRYSFTNNPNTSGESSDKGKYLVVEYIYLGPTDRTSIEQIANDEYWNKASNRIIRYFPACGEKIPSATRANFLGDTGYYWSSTEEYNKEMHNQRVFNVYFTEQSAYTASMEKYNSSKMVIRPFKR